MKNGNAFLVFTNEVTAVLNQVEVVDYYAQLLPSQLDGRFQTILNRFTAATPAEREQFQAALSPQMRSLFGIYGHRAATLAAREEAADWLLSGLVGYGIANYTIPQKRKVQIGLAVYHHVARKLEINPIDLFEGAAQFVSAEIGGEMLLFGRKTDVTLNAYGWQELKTPEGIKYKFSFG
ncbi:MAG: hypothetical protein GY796_13695 [Chloroflexi bacterium]|nr:hypothetical protein [Chloroflexota bacterium]